MWGGGGCVPGRRKPGGGDALPSTGPPTRDRGPGDGAKNPGRELCPDATQTTSAHTHTHTPSPQSETRRTSRAVRRPGRQTGPRLDTGAGSCRPPRRARASGAAGSARRPGRGARDTKDAVPGLRTRHGQGERVAPRPRGPRHEPPSFSGILNPRSRDPQVAPSECVAFPPALSPGPLVPSWGCSVASWPLLSTFCSSEENTC